MVIQFRPTSADPWRLLRLNEYIAAEERITHLLGPDAMLHLTNVRLPRSRVYLLSGCDAANRDAMSGDIVPGYWI